MSEIEKMYKTIFGEFAPNCSLCVKLVDCKIFNNTRNCNKFECDYKSLFTAEKQLALIKWLCQKTYRNYLLIKFNFTNYFWQIECNMTDSDRVDNFSEALASVCNNLWQDLTEQEKQQIKEILE